MLPKAVDRLSDRGWFEAVVLVELDDGSITGPGRQPTHAAPACGGERRPAHDQ
jgi:hypothetical protein